MLIFRLHFHHEGQCWKFCFFGSEPKIHSFFWLPKRVNRDISCIATKVRKWLNFLNLVWFGVAGALFSLFSLFFLSIYFFHPLFGFFFLLSFLFSLFLLSFLFTLFLLSFLFSLFLLFSFPSFLFFLAPEFFLARSGAPKIYRISRPAPQSA